MTHAAAVKRDKGGEDNPFDESFYKYYMENLSEDSINRLFTCSGQEDVFGSELCLFFNKLFRYYRKWKKFATIQQMKSKEKEENEKVPEMNKDESSDANQQNGEDTNEQFDSPASPDSSHNNQYESIFVDKEDGDNRSTYNDSIASEAFSDSPDDRKPESLHPEQQLFNRNCNSTRTMNNSYEGDPRLLSNIERERIAHMSVVLGEGIDSGREEDYFSTSNESIERRHDIVRRPIPISPPVYPTSPQSVRMNRRDVKEEPEDDMLEPSYYQLPLCARVGNLPSHVRIMPSVMPHSLGFINPLQMHQQHKYGQYPNYNDARSNDIAERVGWSESSPRHTIHRDSKFNHSKCAFCKQRDHPSEECSVYGTFEKRETRRMKLKLCRHCLKSVLHPRCSRAEHKKTCTNCGKHTSHPAFCRAMMRRNGRKSRQSRSRSRSPSF